MSINVAAIPSPFIHATIKRRKNTWYTIASGNWTNPAIWMSNSHRRYDFPQAGDDVSVGLGHTVTVNAAAISIYNLTVAGSLLFDTTARTITVNGNIQATGAVNLSGAAHNLILNGVNNYIVNFTSGTTSTVTYSRAGDQPVMDLSYINLTTQNIGAKILPATAFTINGTTIVSTGSVLSKLDTNQVTFIGALNVTSSGIDFSGNPTIENRGGYTLNSLTSFNSGTGAWTFTTATQTATITTSTLQFNGNISVVGAITVNEAGTGIMSLNQPIDCTSASGSVVAKGTIYFNSTSSLPSFTTGTFDRTSFANTVGYTMGASITLPYTSYSSLLTDNTGTKTALGNTSLLGNLTVGVATGFAQTGFFELGTFDLSIAGTTSFAHTISKSGAGSVLFTGLVSNVNSFGRIDFATGNPSVELRGGISLVNFQDTFSYNSNGTAAGTVGVVGYTSAASHFKPGTGAWTFSTNNQSITGSGSRLIWPCPVVISGAIIVTVSGFTYAPSAITNAEATTNGFVFNNTVTGTVAGSTLRAAGFVGFNNSSTPMSTGVFDTTTSANIIGYLYDGSYTLPLTTYSGLYVGGTGTKTLAGNTTVASLTVGGVKATANVLECSTFNLTNTGATTLGDVNGSTATLSKTGAGSILFTGLVSLGNSNPLALDFSGNPSVELRGGLSWTNPISTTFNGGDSTWTFSTNNQSLTGTNATALIINSPILISGAITLTNAAGTNSPQLTLTNTINGNNASSTFDNRGTVQYQAAQQPMLTGVLQTNLAANTFLYNAAGNQDVKGTTYRTLTLARSGIKTLQGNVVVATLYTLTPPATLNTNGFTRT